MLHGPHPVFACGWAGSSPITSMYVHVPIPYSCVSWPASPASPNQNAQGSGGFLIRPMGKSKAFLPGRHQVRRIDCLLKSRQGDVMMVLVRVAFVNVAIHTIRCVCRVE